MKIAYLCLAYNQFEYISTLAEYCSDQSDDFYLHIDSKVEIPQFIYQDVNIKLVDQPNRQRTRWGCIEIVDATMELIRLAKKNTDYDRYVLLSGHDVPLVTKDEFKQNLSSDINYLSVWSEIEKNKINIKHHDLFKRHWYKSKFTNLREGSGENSKFKLYLCYWLNRLIKLIPLDKRDFQYPTYFKGSQWWCLTHDAVSYVLNNYHNNNVRLQFSRMHAPDELVFQTIMMNSKFSKKVGPKVEQLNKVQGIHYIAWGNMGNLFPLKLSDLINAKKLGLLFARKIDVEHVTEYKEYIKNLM